MGLKAFRNPGGAEIRAQHGDWGNPNKKDAKRIKQRQDEYERMVNSPSFKGNRAGYHRPGSAKK